VQASPNPGPDCRNATSENAAFVVRETLLGLPADRYDSRATDSPRHLGAEPYARSGRGTIYADTCSAASSGMLFGFSPVNRTMRCSASRKITTRYGRQIRVWRSTAPDRRYLERAVATGPPYNLQVPYILALDEGTSSARAAVYDQQGRRIAMEAAPTRSAYPQPGWVEQDAEEIWRQQIDVARQALARVRLSGSDIAAIGITNQRETTVVWDRATGAPVGPAIVWQCRRTADFCRELARSPEAGIITRKTGLVIDAYFSASKVRWILDYVEDARRRAADGELLFGNVDTWLIWKLTGGRVHVTDYSNASRTMLMDLETGEWDAGLLGIFDIPAAMMPRIAGSCEVVGTTDGDLFGAAIPIAGIAGDQQAAMAGQVCFRAGRSKNTYGTGCFALLHTGAARPVSANNLVATRAASTNTTAQYAVEGSVFVAGAVVQWLRDELGLIREAAETAEIAASVPDAAGVYLVPAFTGLGAPYWNSSARGLLSGVTRAASRAHIVRAALEGIAYQTAELVLAMEADSGQKLAELRVDGGAAANDFLLQFQADILDTPVVRPQDIETTALGAAFLAGLATGYWRGVEELESFWRVERTFEPRMDESRRRALLAGWKTAVARALMEEVPS
jgi:glycerol kinase